MIVAGVKCDKCGRTDLSLYMEKEVIKTLSERQGWHFYDKEAVCPFCFYSKEIEHNKNKS
ncbi:MAG: hypothetical protein PHY47_25590 [Lachnospiraceae bacterium]|nr:hypothetical protein [Lachnospiraceae bacterium]